MNEAHENEPPRAHHSALGRVFRLARKELREILRDRRTIVTMIAMPILLYPLMSVVFLQFSLASKITTASNPVYNVGVLTEREQEAFAHRLALGQEALQRANKKAAPAPPRKKARRNTEAPQFFYYTKSKRAPANDREREAYLADLKEQLQAKEPDAKLDLIVVIDNLDAEDVGKNGPAKDRMLPCKIYALPNNGAAQSALNYIEIVFAAIDAENLKERLNKPGVTPKAVVLSVRPVFLESAGPEGLLSLAALVPLILILMTITGAVYPAIDMTAGERERGTLEILIAAPVPRFELLAAKYLSVLTVAVLNAVINLVCMTLTVMWAGVSSLLPGVQELSPVLLLQVLGLLLLFAAFFSAVLLCLTSFARSFKEAQAYLIPLMLSAIGPGVMAMMPGLKLEGVLSVLPLVNIVLMGRDLFEGGVDLVTGTIVVLTTLLYALAALSLAARVFGAESVLYSEQSGWSDLLRRPEEPQPTATIPAALWCLALMVPIQFALNALLRNLELNTLIVRIFLGLAVTVLLFGLLPSLFLYLGRVRIRSGLGLTMPRFAAIAASMLLGASLWPLELKLLEQSAVSKMLEEQFGSVLVGLKDARAQIGWWMLATVVVPAILEEFFFRGLLFNALKARCGAAVTIGVSGLLFGVTHVILGGDLGLDRLMPSTLMGLILSTVCWYSGSLWPSMILHVCHNVILLSVDLSGSDATLPWSWVAAGTIGTALGGLLMWQWGRVSEPPT